MATVIMMPAMVLPMPGIELPMLQTVHWHLIHQM